jgi:hypothetical protein
MPYLEIEYRPSRWVHPLRAAIARTPALAGADERWRDSELLDLAFALETRVGNLGEIVQQANEHLRILNDEFADVAEQLDAHVANGVAYRVRNEAFLRRTIIGLTTFVIEARACFETLAKFYRAFVENYFGESISLESAYEEVRNSVAAPGWSESLRLFRHDLLHERSPWIRFEARGGSPKYEPVLILEYRIDAIPGPQDSISLTFLREVGTLLQAALHEIRDQLIQRVKTLQ